MEPYEHKASDFDAHFQQPSTQMLKAALPYIRGRGQRFCSIMIKAMELSSTIHSFDNRGEGELEIYSVNPEKNTPLNMLNDIRPFADSATKETIDLISNLITAFQLYQTYRTNFSANPDRPSEPMELLRPFLSKEQQKMLNQYQTMFQGGAA